MFEKIVADLLSKVLGGYIKGLDAKDLNIALWGGKVELHDLDVNPSAVDSLDIPFCLAAGTLGHLHISVPWKNLLSEPTVLHLKDLFVLLRPSSAQKV